MLMMKQNVRVMSVLLHYELKPCYNLRMTLSQNGPLTRIPIKNLCVGVRAFCVDETYLTLSNSNRRPQEPGASTLPLCNPVVTSNAPLCQGLLYSWHKFSGCVATAYSKEIAIKINHDVNYVYVQYEAGRVELCFPMHLNQLHGVTRRNCPLINGSAPWKVVPIRAEIRSPET